LGGARLQKDEGPAGRERGSTRRAGLNKLRIDRRGGMTAISPDENRVALWIGGPKEGALSPSRAWLRIKLLRWLLCIIVSAGAPDLAWAQYSSSGYSRTSGGSASGYSASSRRTPVTSSSGGYSRRSYGGAGYNTGSLGDRAVSRSASSQALRDYQAAQQPAQPYVRRQPSYGADYAWPNEGQRRPPVWGGQQPERRIARPALPGAGPLTAVALWAALNSNLWSPKCSIFEDAQLCYSSGDVGGRSDLLDQRFRAGSELIEPA
jgi:hypothetical protein